MFKFFKKSTKDATKVAATAKKFYKFVNEDDATDIVIVDESGLHFKVYDYTDSYKLVEVFESTENL